MCVYRELRICLSAYFLSVWYQVLQRREGIKKIQANYWFVQSFTVG